MKVLFVCLGNTCRSPFAEGLARRLASERGLELEFGSAGTIATDGAGPPEDAVAVGLEYGIDLSEHRSRPLTAALEGEADVVHHVFHVPDPVGRGRDAYRESYGLLEREVAGLLDELAGESR